MHLAWLALAILCEVIATSALRATEGFTRLWPSLAVASGYSLSFFALSRCLERIPVGVAYAIWSGVGMLLISLVARAVYGQRLDGPAMAGMGLILAGVLVIQLFSRSQAH